MKKKKPIKTIFDLESCPKFEYESDISDMAKVMASARTQIIEKVIVKIIKRIEGGLPSDHDAEIFGRRNIYPDGLEIWCWRGIPIITVETLEHFVLKITELEYAQ